MNGCRFSDWVGNLTEVRIWVSCGCMDMYRKGSYGCMDTQKGLTWLYEHTQMAHVVVWTYSKGSYGCGINYGADPSS